MSLRIWFMFDNHTFARVEETTKNGLIARARDLFAEDGCGSLFVKDESNASIESLVLHGHRLGEHKWGITSDELARWADEVIAERSFRTLMV